MVRVLSFVVALAFVASADAAHIAVVDSGVDYKHQELKPGMWHNPFSPPNLKADGVVFRDAFHGWNLTNNDNQIIDYRYLGTFSQDVYQAVRIQAKGLLGQATQADRDWVNTKKQDPKFVREMGIFGNFIHGSHVAGIASQGASRARISGFKIIATERSSVNGAFPAGLRQAGNKAELQRYLQELAKRQVAGLVVVGKLVANAGAQVANGSFGTNMRSVKPGLLPLAKQFFGRDPSDKELDEIAKYFVGSMALEARAFFQASPRTLFIIAAGNDGSNNDENPVSPANAKADNAITVAATLGGSSLAVFSNYGPTMVEVAAPGVAIESTIPGDERLPLSGTSMAAPYVANIAGRVFDENPRLTPAQVKRIILSTVDVAPFLRGRVSTGGLVNGARAVQAARASRSAGLDAAIAASHQQIVNQVVLPPRAGQVSEALFPVELPSPF